ncbi:uncharacterized protein LOC123315230 isoform X2 [Coccinella septempunctata]|uniref:uncharacterized protein LOC123315230 isoform X2 n=1 Tax=Coccinella septempunctata TaxID=41139 RepID=UPI001D05D028|nr:uncharacterized protein LOC123315230 isoform X2 [Coccinella septempunctata]
MDQEQDEEYIDKSSEVGKLIIRINQLERRPCLDNSLGEILESFLQSLVRSEDFLRNGIFRINFAESALLLQSSASIYSRKVDLLWDMINECQKRLVSFKTEENEKELKRIEEREAKYKRRRRQLDISRNKDVHVEKSKSFHIDWEEVNDFQHLHLEKDSKLYSEWFKKMVFKWDSQPTPKSNRSLADKQVQFRSLENAIFDQDQDDEFVVHTSKLESVIALEELLLPKPTFTDFSYKLYSELYLIPKFLQENQLSYKDLEMHSIEVEKYLEKYKDQHFSERIYDESYDNNFIIDKNSPQKLRRISVSSTSVSKLPDFDNIDNIQVKKCQENFSTDSSTDSSPHVTGEVNVETNIFSADRSSESLDCENDNTSYENVASSSHNVPTDQITEQIPIDKSADTSLKSVASDSDVLDETRKIVNRTKSVAIKTRRTREKIEHYEIPEKRRRLSKAALKKLATGITVDLEKFNSFFANHYQPEEGEGQVEIQEFSFDDPIDSSSRIGMDDEPLSQLSDHPILSTQDSGYESHFQDNDTSIDNFISPTCELDKVLTEAPLTQEASISEDCPMMPNEPPREKTAISEDCTDNEEVPLYQRVYEWKQYMSDKFKNLKTADFNIHEYGSNIMENFEEGRPQKFSNIVRGKSAAEVTRYFISALQLANTSNVEIQGVQSGKLSNETFELKLISKERYYDRLKDYMAPSEQDYHKRLSTAHRISKKRSVPGFGKSSEPKYSKLK